MTEAIYYLVFCGACITVLKELNVIVDEPYMDEPFHIPQAQAYCRGEFSTWDPKITTPPGLYVMSLLLKRVFMFKCTLPMMRLTTMLALLSLPPVLTHLLCFHKRIRPRSSLLSPSIEAMILGAFPIAWFFGFLYYTEAPSLVFVVWTVVAASQDRHWLAALLGLISCTFRQTNVIWLLYAYASSQLMYLRFRRAAPGASPPKKLHDPPALAAGPGDLVRSVLSAPSVLVEILPSLVPYTLVLAIFGGFVVWNGGIVLGDKANHIPALHIPQLYYFIAFTTAFGWPALISDPGGPLSLFRDVRYRMFGSKIRILVSTLVSIVMAVTVKLFTIHHPFLLADNRHYTFYLWRRIYMFHPLVPYILIPVYIACAWAWFLRVGREQTLLQTLILPVFVLPTLLPTPLLEPRYFLIPYILLRSQVVDMPGWALALEGVWYAAINAVTMGVFLYLPRGDIRFMW
ncbi:glucosyltransferase [Lyophyllum atratum]|nr:glucosyltransferase [Lyophyllum atratum]